MTYPLIQSKSYIYGTDPTRDVTQSIKKFGSQVKQMAAYNYSSSNPHERALELRVRFVDSNDIEGQKVED